MKTNLRTKQLRGGVLEGLRGLGQVAGLALVLALLTLVPAHAGDSAERRAMGFSNDGRYFAFEQFGVQDGSGFPYAEIFVIDIEQDAWVAGTPIRVIVKEDQAELATARQQASDQAAPILKKLGIERPGHLLASNPAPEMGNDPHRVTVNRRYQLQGAYEPQIFQLTELPLPAPESCKGLTDQPVVGFQLQSQKSGASPVTLHRDTSIPESRACPLGYDISAIVAYRGLDQREVLAILVSVSRVGFEGPDRRFLAVTRGPE